MNRLLVTEAEPGDVEYLAPRLRAADRDEVLASSGKGASEALALGLESSAECYSVLEAGRAIAMFGVVDHGKGIGSPWLLGSDRVEAHWFQFARRSRDEFERLRRPWPYLFGFIDDRNKLHHRWLSFLGFEFTECIERYGVGQLPFWRFESRV